MSSLLRPLEDVVLSVKDTDELKMKLISAIIDTNIPPIDKRKLAMNIERCKNTFQIQKLFYNSLLKYEGMGTF